MAYRTDKDLEFLGQLSDKELEPLVDILIKDENGSRRLTETLTISDGYKEYGHHYSKYWKRIAEELQLFGGNTIASLFRGGDGVLYREILTDVAEKFKVKFTKNDSTEEIEQYLLLKLFKDMTDGMSPQQLQQLSDELKLPTTTFTSEAIMASFLTVFKAGGFKSYQLSLIIANTIMRLLLGRGLTVGTNATLARVLGIVTGPIGMGIIGALTLLDIASPAFRVTIPATVCVAALRANHYQAKKAEMSSKIGINLAFIGKTGVGKSSFGNYILGENLFRTGEGKPVTDWPENFQPRTTQFEKFTLNIFDSVGIEADNFKRWKEDFHSFINRNDYLHHHPNHWVHGIFYLLNAVEGRFEDVEKEITQSILDKKIPLYVVLTKVDAVISQQALQEFKKRLLAFNKDLQIYEVCSVASKTRIATSSQQGKEELLQDFVYTLETKIKNQLCSYALFQLQQHTKLACKKLRQKIEDSDITFWNLVKTAIKNEDMDKLLGFDFDSIDLQPLSLSLAGIDEFISSIQPNYSGNSFTEQALQKEINDIEETIEAKVQELQHEFERCEFDLESGNWWEKARAIVYMGSAILSPKEYFLEKIDEISQTIDEVFAQKRAIFDEPPKD